MENIMWYRFKVIAHNDSKTKWNTVVMPAVTRNGGATIDLGPHNRSEFHHCYWVMLPEVFVDTPITKKTSKRFDRLSMLDDGSVWLQQGRIIGDPSWVEERRIR
jgi:hypothetical protein